MRPSSIISRYNISRGPRVRATSRIRSLVSTNGLIAHRSLDYRSKIITHRRSPRAHPDMSVKSYLPSDVFEIGPLPRSPLNSHFTLVQQKRGAVELPSCARALKLALYDKDVCGKVERALVATRVRLVWTESCSLSIFSLCMWLSRIHGRPS